MFKDSACHTATGKPYNYFLNSHQYKVIVFVKGCLFDINGKKWNWKRGVHGTLFCGLRGNFSMLKSQTCP